MYCSCYFCSKLMFMSKPVTVYAEMTPNPATIKFVVDCMLIENGESVEFLSKAECKNHSKFAEALFNFPFVSGVFISGNFVTDVMNVPPINCMENANFHNYADDDSLTIPTMCMEDEFNSDADETNTMTITSRWALFMNISFFPDFIGLNCAKALAYGVYDLFVEKCFDLN